MIIMAAPNWSLNNFGIIMFQLKGKPHLIFSLKITSVHRPTYKCSTPIIVLFNVNAYIRLYNLTTFTERSCNSYFREVFKATNKLNASNHLQVHTYVPRYYLNVHNTYSWIFKYKYKSLALNLSTFVF